MPRRHRPGLPLLLAGVAGCTAPGLGQLTAGDFPATSASTTTTGATALEALPTTSAAPALTTTSGDPGTTAIGGGTTGQLPGTTGDPLPPPAIVDHELDPNPLAAPGPIIVTIATEHATSISMQIDGDPETLHALTGPDTFHTDITLFTSALDNSDQHKATFIARRDALESAPLIIPFTVALPAGGSGLHWDGDGKIGKGVVVGLGVTPSHELIEFGTYHPNQQAHCYLRRRQLDGAFDPLDLVDVAPDTLCTAIDLAVDATGALHVLASLQIDGQLRWWLGELATWDADPLTINTGAPGDVAFALAVDPETDQLAVCGTQQVQGQADAAVWRFNPNKPVLSFLYESGNPLATFVETPNDCLFAGDRLVLAGGVFGSHLKFDPKRERHFLLEVDTLTNQPTWTVADPGPGTQSTAQAIALDGSGHYLTGGYTCDDQCDPRGELRMFSPGGAQIWQRALAPDVLPPRALAWSLADSLLFASARSHDPDTSFFVQAWLPLNGAPLWSYEYMIPPALHSAGALAIGPYGQIYAGGVTAGGYPAVAIIAP